MNLHGIERELCVPRSEKHRMIAGKQDNLLAITLCYGHYLALYRNRTQTDQTRNGWGKR